MHVHNPIAQHPIYTIKSLPAADPPRRVGPSFVFLPIPLLRAQSVRLLHVRSTVHCEHDGYTSFYLLHALKYNIEICS
jgi:hypothetical protein